jgi:hypothetical protein
MSVCVCSLSYPACSAQAPYWPAQLYGIFPRYLINGNFSGGKNTEERGVFSFSLQLLSETFSFEEKLSQI